MLASETEHTAPAIPDRWGGRWGANQRSTGSVHHASLPRGDSSSTWRLHYLSTWLHEKTSLLTSGSVTPTTHSSTKRPVCIQVSAVSTAQTLTRTRLPRLGWSQVSQPPPPHPHAHSREPQRPRPGRFCSPLLPPHPLTSTPAAAAGSVSVARQARP